MVRRRWVFGFETLSFGFLLLAFGARTLHLWSDTPAKWHWFFVAGAALLWLTHYVLLFSVVRCPDCGLNPTRFQNGRKKALSRVYRELELLVVCPGCEAKAAGKEYFNS